jgi:hypothetical protein
MKSKALFVAVSMLALGACASADLPTATVSERPSQALNPNGCLEPRVVLATGSLTRGATTYPAAVLTYDACLDKSDEGSNPGIELWSDAAQTTRLQRSNDNNGQWDYTIAYAFFANGVANVVGSRQGSHDPQGALWQSNNGMFLTSSGVQLFSMKGLASSCVGPFTITKGNTTYTDAHVVYDAAIDASGAGSNPGLSVRRGCLQTAAQIWRANDNNGQWDYRVDAAYVADGVVYIAGARKGSNPATFVPRIWAGLGGGSFLTQYAGF